MLENIKVFLDRNVISLSVILEPALKKSSVNWGSHIIIDPIHGYRRKPPWGDRRDDEVACIPTIASLAKKGQIRLYIGLEVQFESFSATCSANGTKGDLFRDVEMEIVESPVDRSYFKSQSLKQICARDELIEFCDTLINLNVDTISGVPEFWKKFPEGMKANLSNLSRLKEILEALPHRKHWPDAFHLWTAETHDAAYFVTVDYRFINALTMTANIGLPTKLVRPSELLDELCIKDREPLPFEGEGFINFALAY